MDGEQYRIERIAAAARHVDRHPRLDAIHEQLRKAQGSDYVVPSVRFKLNTHWDLDSTPKPARMLSRALGIRTLQFEKAIILASLPHDIRYYYGGSLSMKNKADRLFEQDLHKHAATTGAGGVSVRAWGDRMAVAIGGSNPLTAYGWGYSRKRGARVMGGVFSKPSAAQRQAIERFVVVALQVYADVWKS